MSLRSLIKHHLVHAAGAYHPNHFLLILDEGTPFLDSTNEAKIQNNEFLHVFIHEYWHYWQNISTLSGFKSFAFTQHLLAYFSKTLAGPANGTSDGGQTLTVQDEADIHALLQLRWDLDGDKAPTPQDAEDWEVRSVVLSISESDAPAKYQSRDAPNPLVRLNLECQWPNGHTSSKYMHLGARAIEESVAFLVEEQVRKALPGVAPSPPPEFPYRVVERVLSYILKDPVSPHVAAALGTLALQGTHPGPALIELARNYKDTIDKLKNEQTALKAIVEIQRRAALDPISTVLGKDLPELQKMHRGRGLMEGALEHLGSTIRRALSRRLKEPLFDLDVVFPKAVPAELKRHYREFPPCDLLQKRAGDRHAIERDALYSFDESPLDHLGYYPYSYTRSLQAQQNFLFAHLDTMTGKFVTSAQAHSECPYFTSCNLAERRANPTVCSIRPWEAYSSRSESCWYGTAVTASMGTVNIRKSFTS